MHLNTIIFSWTVVTFSYTVATLQGNIEYDDCILANQLYCYQKLKLVVQSAISWDLISRVVLFLTHKRNNERHKELRFI